MNKLKIAHRLFGGFAIVVLLLVGAVSSTLWMLVSIQHDSNDVAADLTPTALTALTLTSDVQGSLAALRGYMLTGNATFKEERAATWKDIAQNRQVMDALVETMPADDPDHQTWAKFKGILDEFSVAQDKVEAIADPANIAPAIALLVKEAAPRANELLTIMVGPKGADGMRSGGWVDEQQQFLKDRSESLNVDISSLVIVQWVLLGLGVVLGALISLATARAIATPLLGMTKAMGKLADGDLKSEIPYTSRKDEIGDMAAAVEVFKQNGLKVEEMNAAEAVRAGQTRERTHAMNALVSGLTTVVDAAVDGDFSRRIENGFKDDDLRGVAASVNNLVETVDRGISETGHVLAALAETDLTLRVEGSYKGAFAKLKADTNAVGDKLTEIVSQLRTASGAVKTATGEILSGANDLAERTTKQAAAIEETSAAMEQLATTVVDNAKRADAASAKARAVSKTAEDTGEVMRQANGAMERISSSSSKISNIIGMIDDIAFQTNLLALNASVEAARAGDAGKGFAVVAVEVRRLAQSAAQASSEVKVLIEQSSNEVSGGSRLVSEATDKLLSMLNGVRENVALIEGIAQASQEQSSAITQVTTAVRQMDEMTQHNAALVEETNAAIEQTEAQASELDRIVDIFVLDANGNKSRAPVALHPAAPKTQREVQKTVRTAARSYLTSGNAAISQDWNEF